ncbi:uncharacterized protein LOC127258395 [Andrographis paniculata]|uniref:uncharacterized protein LOC127258395 n=1 Tax=Andrographis paniculata TaxID=175694 RepID=UPI0021E8707D|nr:uncharacterized protein LOC127258395 [Andrographis paniculata]
METAPPMAVPWVPEDDLALKNAVEAGASLEALAKGAVQFSRKYTLKELRERWFALLYDSDISTQASERMFEHEISGLTHAPKLNKSENTSGNKEVSLKRKAGSVRRDYYAMRKKLRAEVFSSNLFGPTSDKQMMLDGNALAQNCILGDDIPDHLRLQEEDLDILRHAFLGTRNEVAAEPSANSFDVKKRSGIIGGYGYNKNVASALTKGKKDILEINIKNTESPLTLGQSSVDDDNPHNSAVGFEGRQQCNTPNSDRFSSFQGVAFAPDSPHVSHWGAVQDFLAPSIPVSMSLQDAAHDSEDVISNDIGVKEDGSGPCTGELVYPDSLLNLSNDEEILLEDADGKNGDKKVRSNNIDSVLEVSNKAIQENDVSKAENETQIVVDASAVSAHGESAIVVEASAVSAHGENAVAVDVAAPSGHGDHKSSQPALDVPLKPTVKSDFSELSDGKICCVLNTEDTEIPCNDDIFLLIHPSTSFGSLTQPTTAAFMNASSVAHAKNSEQVMGWPEKATGSTKPFGLGQKIGKRGLPGPNYVQPLKSESYNSRSQVLSRFMDKTIGESSQNKPLNAIALPSTNRPPEKEVSSEMKVGENPATTSAIMEDREASYGGAPIQEPALDSSASDLNEAEIDDDVPHFSDVEAMILDMDLEPCDQDSNNIRKVPNYQYDETKRTIIRLEQNAYSCLQRAMTSRRAFAIFYGRHLRHYIKKPEVLLGRSTDDIEVDIDLSREGRANKISRRQAIIKMEDNGSFFLRNLGKSSVTVNGLPVARGQLVNLSSSSLVEIKGMNFVFEINQGYVRNYLANLCRKNKRKLEKTDWSGEDES